MAQRIVERLIGRLIADEQFRTAFLSDPERTLLDLNAHGLELSRTEIAALLNTDRAMWSWAAAQLDSRLQKANLEPATPSQKERDDHV